VCDELRDWLALRVAEAKLIDPASAKVCWQHGYVSDPYDLDSDLPDEFKQVGRVYFARRPDSDIWVCFYDLPHDVRDALWKRRNFEGDDDELPFQSTPRRLIRR
jgi:hypothetical protein